MIRLVHKTKEKIRIGTFSYEFRHKYVLLSRFLLNDQITPSFIAVGPACVLYLIDRYTLQDARCIRFSRSVCACILETSRIQFYVLITTPQARTRIGEGLHTHSAWSSH